MSRNIRVFFAGFLCCILLTAGMMAVIGEPADTEVKAILSNTIKMKLFGNDFAPKNDDGTYLKPLIYNGRTYLPVKPLGDALGIAVEWDGVNKIVWLGGKTQIVPIDDTSMYEDYSRTIVTTDTDKLTTADTTYKWGIANISPLNSVYYGCCLKPEGKYKRFTASIFLSEDTKKELTMDIRKDNKQGVVLKSLQLKPGETVEIDIDISGVDTLFIFSQVGSTQKLIIGEPAFRNDTTPQ